MANTVNIFKTETELKLLIAALLKEAGRLGGDTHYTDEGKAEIWGRHLEQKDLDNRIRKARTAVWNAQRYVKSAEHWTMTQALGERPAETDTATELRLARILGRRDEWTTEQILDAVKPILGTPLCAELVAELDDRGQVNWDVFGPLVVQQAPELIAHNNAYRKVYYGVDQLVALEEQLAEAMDVKTVYGAKDGRAKVKQNRYSAVSDYVGGDTFTIAETGEFKVDMERLAEVTDVMARRMPSKYAKD